MYKYNEDKYIKDISNYVDSTYGQHYVNQGIQVIDIWKARGTLESTAADTALKYIVRYGKKDGRNRKDLLKAIHYIILMMHAADSELENNNEARARSELSDNSNRSKRR